MPPSVRRIPFSITNRPGPTCSQPSRFRPSKRDFHPEEVPGSRGRLAWAWTFIGKRRASGAINMSRMVFMVAAHE